MRFTAIIQARILSTRLPGKVLLPLGDSTVLEQVVNRVKNSTLLDEVVVATTNHPADDSIAAKSQEMGCNYFRGNQLDVLARYYYAAQKFSAENIVRITSDCPLYDGKILDEMLRCYMRTIEKEGRLDYLSNTLQRTFPRGLDTEIFGFKVLEKVYKSASQEYQREHVTSYIYENRDQFLCKNYIFARGDYSRYRWTLDTDDDYKFITEVYEKVKPNHGNNFSTDEVLELLQRNPGLLKLNSMVIQKQLTG